MSDTEMPQSSTGETVEESSDESNGPSGDMEFDNSDAGPTNGMPPPGMMGEDSFEMSARPYIGRALKLLSHHKTDAVGAMLLLLVVSLAPFLVSASFGPIIQILGESAMADKWDTVWSSTGSLYSKADPNMSGIEGWLATPLSFTTIFVIWAVASVASVALQFFQSWMMTHLEQKLDTEIRQRVYDHIQTLSLDFFTGEQTGALMQRVLMETQGVQKLLTDVMLTPLIEMISLALALAYLLGLSWQMTLAALVLGPFAFFLFRITMKNLEKAADDTMMTTRELNAELNESISGMADIQVFNAQEKRSTRFNVAARAVASSSARMLTWMQFSNSSSQIYVAMSTTVVLLIGILFGTKFGLTLASLIVFMGFVPSMFAPVQQIIMSYTTYQSLVPSIVGTYELLDTQPTVVDEPDAADMGEVHGHVSFDNVTFSYTPMQKILDGISFQIREGETVALVGPIGCGKSTIFNLLLRFLNPESGRIVIDGQEISGVTLNSLRKQVSKLSQFPFFLKDSIRENVRLGRADARDDEIEAACTIAHVHDVIMDPKKLSKGYDTVVDVQVPSGGQKRLIALARCLLRKPEVLLLDEPTENLDADQRNRLTKVIREYARERTCLVISHDLNFVAAVSDRIIVLNHGRVADEGTHDELLQREGLYKTLYELKNIDPALLRKREEPQPAMPPGGMMGMPM
jgi:ATP-binding cassette, subfamily B, bacterial